MEENKIKVVSRTSGLMKAVIEDSFSKEQCQECSGQGFSKTYAQSIKIKNLKTKTGNLSIKNECNACQEGVVYKKIRIIRNSKISVIL